MALRWHPDKNIHAQEEATEQMKKVTLVYNVLIDGWPTSSHFTCHLQVSDAPSMTRRAGRIPLVSSGGNSRFPRTIARSRRARLLLRRRT